MDPYQTLGISRTCTREEVKQVFRVRAWYAHPDRGGENATFIQLCTAYKLILDDLDRRPNPRLPDLSRARRPARPARPPVQDGDPDLIFLDEVAPIRWPPKPPDPNWTADLVLLEEAPPANPAPQPPDPRAAQKTYRSWLQQVPVRSARRPSAWRSGGVDILGPLIILAALVGSLWVCWIAWRYEPKQAEQAARQPW
jgi:hypothetical protein